MNEIDALYSNCGKPDDTVETGDAPETYLTAAGALASSIGSSTYAGWRKLLIQLEFETIAGKAVFNESNRFKDFKTMLDEQAKLLWADNAIYRHKSNAHRPPTPCCKTAKKTAMRGFAVCVGRTGRDKKKISKRK